MYVIGNKNKKGQSDEVAYVSGIYSNSHILGIAYSTQPGQAQAIDHCVEINGGNADDYVYFTLDDSSDDVNRIMNLGCKGQFGLTWNGDTITALDFSDYDSLGQIGVSSNKTAIDSDGVEIAVLTFTVYQSDGTTIDTDYNDGTPIDIDAIFNGIDNSDIVPISVTFNNGVATYNFTSQTPGTYLFPASFFHDSVLNIRMQNNIKVKARL